MNRLKLLVPLAVLAVAGTLVALGLRRPPAQLVLFAPPEAAAELKIDDKPARIEPGQTLILAGPAVHKVERVGMPAEMLAGADGWGIPTRRAQCFELTDGGSVRGFMLTHPFHLPARAFAEGRFRSLPCRDLKYDSAL